MRIITRTFPNRFDMDELPLVLARADPEVAAVAIRDTVGAADRFVIT